jgi:hypothetical protein
MKSSDFNQYNKDIVKWTGNVAALEKFNTWLALSSNIWNNVPQPDRGNRSANEIVAEEKQRQRGEPALKSCTIP